MQLKIYDNKILAPLKHGTRFLDKIFQTYKECPIIDLYKSRYWREIDVWFIYRNPEEHLISALHTEIINRDASNMSVSDVIKDFVREKGTTHWNKDILKGLSIYWSNANKEKFKVVELNHLSDLLIELGYEIPKFNPIEYEFNHIKGWVTKQDIVLMVEKDFPKEWEYLMDIVKSEMEYYYKLNNKIVIPTKFI